MKLAKAHTRIGRKYSPFHCSLMADSEKIHALHLLYSKENTKQILLANGYDPRFIDEAVEHMTIDVQKYVVRVHIPRWVPVKTAQLRYFSILNGCKVINGKLHRPIPFFSSFISKREYLQILIDRNQAKSDPYKVFSSEDWDEFVHQGVEENHVLTLDKTGVTCTCKAYSGLTKAFEQDPYMLKLLIEHPELQGQIPDKHVFSVWRHFGVSHAKGYRYQYELRRLSAHGLTLDEITPGSYAVCGRDRRVIGNIRKCNGLWFNSQFLTRYRDRPGDGIGYLSASDCAIALTELLGERAEEERSRQFLHPKIVPMEIKREVTSKPDPFHGLQAF
jgi:hypothetical protein